MITKMHANLALRSAAVFLIIVEIFRIFSGQMESTSTSFVQVGSSTNVTILKDSEFAEIYPEVCKRTNVISDNKTSKHYMMCCKPLDIDTVVSGSIYHFGMWETNNVQYILKWLNLYRGDVTFLDLGANIGTFSVAASAFGHSVISVDPIKTNLAYVHHSVLLSGGGGSVKYLHNSVSDLPNILYPWNRDPTNEGAMTLISKKDTADKPSEQIGTPIQSITFEEILDIVPTQTAILKIDVEGYECKALGKYMASPKKSHYIPYIMMEWEVIAMNRENNCPQLKTFQKDFVSSGYSPFSEFMKPCDPQGDLPPNVVWIHKGARKE